MYGITNRKFISSYRRFSRPPSVMFEDARTSFQSMVSMQNPLKGFTRHAIHPSSPRSSTFLTKSSKRIECLGKWLKWADARRTCFFLCWFSVRWSLWSLAFHAYMNIFATSSGAKWWFKTAWTRSVPIMYLVPPIELGLCVEWKQHQYYEQDATHYSRSVLIFCRR